MGKNRQAHEIVEELMAVNGIDEKTLAEKAGVSELVIRNYLSGLNKDSRNYARLKEKVKEAFGLGDDFFDESHVYVPAPAAVKEEKKPAKIAKVKVEKNDGKKKSTALEGTQLVFDLKGQISEEDTKKDNSADISATKSKDKKVAESGSKKQSAPASDPLMSAIKSSGSKTKLAGKKKDITPDAAGKWAAEYEDEMKQSVGRVFSVLRESLKEVFKKEEAKPAYPNKKITEIVELASKAKEDDLNLIIAMLKKITK